MPTSLAISAELMPCWVCMSRFWSTHWKCWEDLRMKDDHVIVRIREVRHKISETHGHDPKRVIDYYIQLQKQYKDRLVQGNTLVAPPPKKAESKPDEFSH